jgi:RNA polymerase sigma-70 factor (ECF subfamily)
VPEPTEINTPEKWVELFGDYLFGFALMRVSRREVAEDLVQDTFLSAYRARESFLNQATVKTWLTSILKRKIIDYYRKKSTQNEINIFDKNTDDDFMNHFFENESGNSGHWTEGAAPKEWNGNFQTNLERNEFNEILKNCLGKLTPKLSAVFTLKNMDDMDSDEICRELDISPSNYWVMMHRAKLQLRECIQTNWMSK